MSRPKIRWRSRLARGVVEALGIVLLVPILLALAAWRRTGDPGFVRIGDDRVALRVDRATGERVTIAQPGIVPFVPLLQKVYLLDKNPRVVRMDGTDQPGSVPRLIVRARDGSSLWIERIEIQYAIHAESASLVLDESGPDGEARTDLLLAYARTILREEIGQFTSEELVRGETGQRVAHAAAERLGEAVRPLGLTVLSMAFGRPRFDEAYEDAIVRRKTFEQDAEQLRAQLDRLEKEREHRTAAVVHVKRVELEKLEGDRVRDLGAARKEDLRARQEAEAYANEQRAAGMQSKEEKERAAAMAVARDVAQGRALYREAVALERAGDFGVREALVEKLSEIPFDLAPFRREPAVGERDDASGGMR